MKVHEFFHKFANTPLTDRIVAINVTKYGLKNLSDVYAEIQRLENFMRPYVIERDNLINIAEEFYEQKSIGK